MTTPDVIKTILEAHPEVGIEFLRQMLVHNDMVAYIKDNHDFLKEDVDISLTRFDIIYLLGCVCASEGDRRGDILLNIRGNNHAYMIYPHQDVMRNLMYSILSIKYPDESLFDDITRLAGVERV